jgi:hypothetical protein
MVSFSFRKLIKSVEAHYATCETYCDSGWIEQKSGSGSEDDDVWKIDFKTEFNRDGLFRFEWRDHKDVFTQHFPNAENVVWANKYGAFGRFDFEENTHHFLDLAQALEACSTISSGVAPLLAAMLYPELRGLFERPASLRRPSRVHLTQRNKKQALTVFWQREVDGLILCRQVLFDVDDLCLLEIYDTSRRVPAESDSAEPPEPEPCAGVLWHYLSTAADPRRAYEGQGDVVSSTRIVFETVRITPSSLVLPSLRAD